MTENARATLVRLPATGCRSYYEGRCLYEEQLNPGLNTQWRCIVLSRWEAVYDEFLDRAENFGLAESAVAELWRKRFERLAEESISCPDFEAGPSETMPECRRLFTDICLLRLPACSGQCGNYRLHTGD